MVSWTVTVAFSPRREIRSFLDYDVEIRRVI